MFVEISKATVFLGRYLEGRVPRRKVALFRESLANKLIAEFDKHWYEYDAAKGSGSRTLYVNVNGQTSKCLTESAGEVGIEAEELMQVLPTELRLRVDPFKVWFTVGETGAGSVIYECGNKDGNLADLEKLTSGRPQASESLKLRVEKGNGKLGEISLAEEISERGYCGANNLLSATFEFCAPVDYAYTAGDFATTRFGTTKQKTNLTELREIQAKASELSTASTDPNPSMGLGQYHPIPSLQSSAKPNASFCFEPPPPFFPPTPSSYNSPFSLDFSLQSPPSIFGSPGGIFGGNRV